jgi:hypothetical protein
MKKNRLMIIGAVMVMAVLAGCDNDGGSAGIFTITGYAKGPAAVYAVTGPIPDYPAAEAAIATAAGRGAIVSAAGDTVIWNVAPPLRAYTILVLPLSAPTKIYGIPGAAFGGGAGMADWGDKTDLSPGGGITTPLEGTWTKYLAPKPGGGTTTLTITIVNQQYTFDDGYEHKEEGVFIYDASTTTHGTTYFNRTREYRPYSGGSWVSAPGRITTMDCVLNAASPTSIAFTWLSGESGAATYLDGTPYTGP